MISSTLTIEAEIRAIADFLDLPGGPLETILPDLARRIPAYAEIAMNRNGLEVITGGRAEEAKGQLLAIAARHQTSDVVRGAFAHLTETFPDCFLGLKLCLGSIWKVPSLYVRLLKPIDDIFDCLAHLPGLEPGLAALKNRLANASTMYGLAFFTQDDSLALKTYTIADVRCHPGNGTGNTTDGFVSHRLTNSRLDQEVKHYLPNVNLHQLPYLGQRWPELINFLRFQLGYQTAGHLSWRLINSQPTDYKLYFERIGAIATDFSQR